MAKQQEYPTKNIDLYSERAAILLYGGFRNLTRRVWMKNIAANMHPSGGWPINTNTPEMVDPHSMVLAVWALIQHRKASPSQYTKEH